MVCFVLCVLCVLNFVLQYEIFDAKDNDERKLNMLLKYEFS